MIYWLILIIKIYEEYRSNILPRQFGPSDIAKQLNKTLKKKKNRKKTKINIYYPKKCGYFNFTCFSCYKGLKQFVRAPFLQYLLHQLSPFLSSLKWPHIRFKMHMAIYTFLLLLRKREKKKRPERRCSIPHASFQYSPTFRNKMVVYRLWIIRTSCAGQNCQFSPHTVGEVSLVFIQTYKLKFIRYEPIRLLAT